MEGSEALNSPSSMLDMVAKSIVRLNPAAGTFASSREILLQSE
jgi:hypothetical protein